jgi:DNA-binding NarL/FixJ family response regulator
MSERTIVREEAGATPLAADLAPFLAERSAARPSSIRVLLADDHRIFREGLVELLEEQPDIELVGEAADGEEAVALALQNRPDVVLMDVTMPRLDGLGATRRITAALPQVRVIGLSMHAEDDMAAAMLAAGAVAYVAKGGASESLLDAIRGR